MEMNGADIVVRCLADEGVEHVFGYPGGAVLYIYDAIDQHRHDVLRAGRTGRVPQAGRFLPGAVGGIRRDPQDYLILNSFLVLLVPPPL